MKVRASSLLTAFLMLSAAITKVAAQNERVVSRHYTMNDGLPETVVNWVLQDKRGFLWLATTSGLSKFDGYKFTTYKRDPAFANSLGQNFVTRLWEDRYGRLWVGHVGGLDLFNPQTEKFYHFPANDSSKWKVNRFRARKDGKLWICADNGVYIADTETLSIEKMTDLPDDGYWDIAETLDGSVWAAGEHSVIHIDAKRKQKFTYKHYLDDPDGLPYGIKGFSIYLDAQGKVWTGGDGLKLFDENTKSFTRYLSGYRVRQVLGESEGKLLIGHDFGLGLFDPKTSRLDKIAGERPTSILKDTQGIIWHASFSGLKQISIKARKFTKEEQYEFIGGIAQDGGRDIWILSTTGIFRFNPSFRKILEHKNVDRIQAMTADGEGKILFISPGKLETYDFRSESISVQPMALIDQKREISTISFIDSFGNIWTGGWAGIGKYNSKTNTIEVLKSFPDALVSGFLEDANKNLWIGSSAGLWRYNLISHKLDIFKNNPADKQSLSDNRVNHITMDGNQNIWIGTGTGLNKMIKGTEKREPRFTSWTTATSGLQIDNISCIVDGADGTLWLACGNMISHFDPRKNTFRNYDYTDFLTPTRFTRGFVFGKGLRTSDGKIIFGTMRDGLVIFHPDSLVDNSYVPPVVITDFLIDNHRVPIAKTEADTVAWKTPLERGISYANEMQLTYQQNDFVFEFAALNYINPENNRYKYKLEPYESEWIETNASNRIARYTNMNPGTYKFRVIGSNNDGVWNNEGTSLTIVITPPWWMTSWAYTMYGLVFVSLVFLWRRYDIKRVRLKHRAEHLSELDTLKSRFFANISHEFRTPITLMLGPLKDLYNGKSKEDPKSLLGSVIRNGQRLHRLINQLLDLSKIEAGKMHLHAASTDLVEFLREAAASYESMATEKKIKYVFYPEVDELSVYIDAEKMEKVVHNLLSNAFKFTKPGGEVILNLKAEKNNCLITVKDTGIGIPPNQLEKVFDRFYQVDSSQTRGYEGSGLGMALAKELVELHMGKISVQSTEGKGTTFTVSLPLGKDHLNKEEISDTAYTSEKEILSEVVISGENGEGETATAQADGQPVLLIVEDNADMRSYIRKTLSDQYSILEAENGKSGVKVAEETIPDLIISDIMMPEMDGYKLCSVIKSNELTSHIPVILLTAKADRESKLSGLETGADDYLSKPFDADELKLIVRNRIEERRKMRERFSREVTLEPKQISISSLDEKFLQRVLGIIEAHMDDERFSIEELSSEAGFSNMHFYRKIKALSGQTPSQFFRTIRLKRAAELLAKNSDNVTQVAYSVGFSSLSYFNKCFKEQFGVTPGQYNEESIKPKR